ncbi:hypothetical protein F511_37434 [Dorcoceras hygrometricum]|uniref:Uncharacterized protein n=1 Tax=Dorcoceras hygrometricum TaxID=472368 RepID=A0A2Z7AWK7_9LAMI|nr:hypothetical protein F511_37434 [Dorcoceras hygrometricum]
MFTLNTAKGCSIVPRIHKFYLTNLNKARQYSRPETSSFRDLLQGRFVASNVLLVQPDKGVSVLVVDRIGDYLPQSTEKSRVLEIPVGARHKCQQGVKPEGIVIGLHCILHYP